MPVHGRFLNRLDGFSFGKIWSADEVLEMNRTTDSTLLVLKESVYDVTPYLNRELPEATQEELEAESLVSKEDERPDGETIGDIDSPGNHSSEPDSASDDEAMSTASSPASTDHEDVPTTPTNPIFNFTDVWADREVRQRAKTDPVGAGRVFVGTCRDARVVEQYKVGKLVKGALKKLKEVASGEHPEIQGRGLYVFDIPVQPAAQQQGVYRQLQYPMVLQPVSSAPRHAHHPAGFGVHPGSGGVPVPMPGLQPRYRIVIPLDGPPPPPRRTSSADRLNELIEERRRLQVHLRQEQEILLRAHDDIELYQQTIARVDGEIAAAYRDMTEGQRARVVGGRWLWG